jgi:hypothetical protein
MAFDRSEFASALIKHSRIAEMPAFSGRSPIKERIVPILPEALH